MVADEVGVASDFMAGPQVQSEVNGLGYYLGEMGKSVVSSASLRIDVVEKCYFEIPDGGLLLVVADAAVVGDEDVAFVTSPVPAQRVP